jgi:hypothetical protein
LPDDLLRFGIKETNTEIDGRIVVNGTEFGSFGGCLALDRISLGEVRFGGSLGPDGIVQIPVNRYLFRNSYSVKSVKRFAGWVLRQ